MICENQTLSQGPSATCLEHKIELKREEVNTKSGDLLRDVVNGEVVLRGGKPTAALPGQLLRGPLARRS